MFAAEARLGARKEPSAAAAGHATAGRAVVVEPAVEVAAELAPGAAAEAHAGGEEPGEAAVEVCHEIFVGLVPNKGRRPLTTQPVDVGGQEELSVALAVVDDFVVAEAGFGAEVACLWGQAAPRKWVMCICTDHTRRHRLPEPELVVGQAEEEARREERPWRVG